MVLFMEHVVKQGEYLSSIAKQYGFVDWHIIYDHPANAELKKKRSSPNVLLPGDVFFIPEKQKKDESCPTDNSHTFEVRTAKLLLQLTLKDAEERPFKNQPYTLVVDCDSYKGTTDEDGRLRQQIAIGATTATVMLEKVGILLPLRIGHLDPVHDEDADDAIVSGVQARLNNLGFHCGEVDGIAGPRTRAALASFQSIAMGRDNPDGEPDKETREVMKQHHGC